MSDDQPDYASWDVLAARDPVTLRVPRELVEAVFKYRLGALRLMLYIGAQAPQLHEGRMTVALSGQQIKSILGIDGDRKLAPLKGKKTPRVLTEHAQIEQVCDELASRIVSLKVAREDGSTTEYRGPACAWWSRNLERQEYRFAIDGAMLPLWQRVQQVVMAKWDFLTQFKSEYGIRIFLLVMAWRGKDEKTGKLKRSWNRPFTVAWLRDHLGIEEGKYKLNADFRRYVVEAAVKDINAFSPIYVTAEVIRKGPRGVILEYAFSATIKITKTGGPRIALPEQDQWDAKVATFLAFAETQPEHSLVMKIREREGEILAGITKTNGPNLRFLSAEMAAEGAQAQALEEHRAEIEELLSSTHR